MRDSSDERRRELVAGFLDDLRSQRKVDMRDAMEELMHLTFDIDNKIDVLTERVARLERQLGGR
jgi:hypothetical protein